MGKQFTLRKDNAALSFSLNLDLVASVPVVMFTLDHFFSSMGFDLELPGQGNWGLISKTVWESFKGYTPYSLI